MNVESVNIDSLIEDPKNARKHGKKNLKAIEESLTRYGQVEPLIVQKGTNIVAGGNGRLTVMRSMEWSQVSVVFVDVTDEEFTALGLALNRTGELAEWDATQLVSNLEELLQDESFQSLGEYEDLLSFDPKFLNSILNEAHGLSENADLAVATREGSTQEPELTEDLTYSVIADFDNEEDQSDLLSFLEGKGIKCRLLIS